MSAPLAILAIGDLRFREKMRSTLTDLRWKVLEANGGADALAHLESGISSTVIMDDWFPDLEVGEFVKEVESSFPNVELVSTDGLLGRPAKPRNSRHGEILYALRMSQECNGTTKVTPSTEANPRRAVEERAGTIQTLPTLRVSDGSRGQVPNGLSVEDASTGNRGLRGGSQPLDQELANSRYGLPEFIGSHPVMLEMCHRIRLVAGRETPVLIQGPSGSGKELVAHALHRLSQRKDRPFVALNCAAIPESLLESELFGHTKGSFTGALHGRAGRIEAASGGTLFLDEIGEMPLTLQAKLLRFLESGEIQRLGANEPLRINARVIAASNQQLGALSAKGEFRLDLFYRLAVFVIRTPPLNSHMDDLPVLANFFLTRLLDEPGSKHFTNSAMQKLSLHEWPGNVRELAHVIERSFILAEHRQEITSDEIEFAHVPSA